MPDRGGSRALLRLCDSVSGANWRPTRFEDELTVLRYACCVCDIVPSTTVVLPCSHVLCELCVTGCVVQDDKSVCPLDTEPFCEDECQKLKLPAKTKRNLKAHCWNEPDGCQFVGTIEDLLLHYDRECAFHAVQCRRCEQRILRRHIASHYVAGCSQNASCASGGEPHRQDGYPARYTLQRQMNKDLEVCRASESARSQDISRAVSGFENSLQREMESIEANICTMVTRQLNAGLEELRASNIDPCSDHLSSLQSQMNELVEQSMQRDASQLEEIGRVLRESQIEGKENVKVQLEEIVGAIRMSEAEVEKNVNTQLKQILQVMRDSGSELKEHVSRVEANISSRLTDQQQSLQRALASLKQNHESTEREVPLAASTSGKEQIQSGFNLNALVNESLKTLEFLRQKTYRHDKEPWVSCITGASLSFTGVSANICAIVSNEFPNAGFDVTLKNCENIFNSDRAVFTVANQYYTDMRIQLTFFTDTMAPTLFGVKVECVKSSVNSSFPFTALTVSAVRVNPRRYVSFQRYDQEKCSECSRKCISHFHAHFAIEKGKLAKDSVIPDGKLQLNFRFLYGFS